MEPLKQENERVIQENNLLHQQMIRVKEESQQAISQLQLRLKTLESNAEDFAFLQ